MSTSRGFESCCGRFPGCGDGDRRTRRLAVLDRTLSGRVAELRPAYLPPDPAGRTANAAGEIAQCDFWLPNVELPVGLGQTPAAKLLPVLTMVCGSPGSRCDAAALQIGGGSV
jgi:hypothetical protein